MILTRFTKGDSIKVSIIATRFNTNVIMFEISAANKGFLKNKDMKRLNVIKENENSTEIPKNCNSTIETSKFL